MKKYKIMSLLLAILLLTSCAVKYVADYDQTTLNKIIDVSKQVDLFYITLLDIESTERDFEKFTQSYKEIEVELRSLVMINKIRPLNDDSTRIAEQVLEFWLKYKTKHKEKNRYSNAQLKLHQKRFNRLFTAMAIGETLKQNEDKE